MVRHQVSIESLIVGSWLPTAHAIWYDRFAAAGEPWWFAMRLDYRVGSMLQLQFLFFE